MKILVDENIPLATVRALRGQGHDVLDIRGTTDEGIPDYALWDMAQREERLLITTDKGFVHNREQLHHGILIIRLRQPNRRKLQNFPLIQRYKRNRHISGVLRLRQLPCRNSGVLVPFYLCINRWFFQLDLI